MGSGPRYPSAAVRREAERLLAGLGGHAVVCGSLRRLRPTAGDVDLVLDGPDLSDALEALRGLGCEVVVPAGDGPRTELRLGHLQVDVWSPASPDSVGACVLHATGSGIHNTVMRRWARLVHGCQVTWRGVHRISDGLRLDDGTEDGVRRVVGWPLLTPGDREVDPFRPPDWLLPFLAEMDRLETS